MRKTQDSSLHERYQPDTELLKFLQSKLLEPNFAGQIDSVELAFIKGKLRKSQRLRNKWGFSKGRLSSAKIQRVAMFGTNNFEKEDLR